MRIRVDAPESTSKNAMFVALILVGLGCWWHWVSLLFTLAHNNEQYSHIFLVLPVSVSLALLEGRAKGVKPSWSLFPGLSLILASLMTLLAAQFAIDAGSERALIAGIASLVVFWVGLVMLFFGVEAVRKLLFPMLFLFLIVPIPQFLVDKCIVGLQVASTDATYMIFRWAGVPVLRSGFVLSLPTLDIEVAKQCSGIRSGLILVITGLVLGHLYLRSYWGKVVFVLATIPISIAKNAVRIFTLSMLGMHVDAGFLSGRLHRNGGVMFFVLALAGMAILIKVLKKAEAWADMLFLPE